MWPLPLSHMIALHRRYYGNSLRVGWSLPVRWWTHVLANPLNMQAYMTICLWRPMSIVLVVCIWPLMRGNSKNTLTLTHKAYSPVFSTFFKSVTTLTSFDCLDWKHFLLWYVVSSPFLYFSGNHFLSHLLPNPGHNPLPPALPLSLSLTLTLCLNLQ